MERKLPYYMAYPMPLLYDDERLERRDFEYMKSMYPETAKRALPFVEEECDRMEYEGSMMFDRYPDRLMMEMICRRIYRGLRPEDVEEDGRLHVDEKYFMLVQVMLMQEMYRRRCRHYRCRRWY